VLLSILQKNCDLICPGLCDSPGTLGKSVEHQQKGEITLMFALVFFSGSLGFMHWFQRTWQTSKHCHCFSRGDKNGGRFLFFVTSILLF
jgi:hypothetical protein